MISSSIGSCDQLLDLLSYQSFDLSVGYRQIKSVPTMLVMLSYSWLIPRACTITSLVWPMLSPCSLNYGIPFERKPRRIVVEPIDNILAFSIILLSIKLVLETFESIFFMLAHEVFVWWKEWLPLIHVHLVKVAAVNLRKLVLLPLESSQSVMHTCEVFCGSETCNLHSICVPSTPSHWLICSRRRSSFIRANHMTYARTSLSTVMVPNQNSVVFYCKTTTWSCLSGTTCSHVCSRTSSCFGAYYRSSFPENLATLSRRFVLQTFIFLPRLDESGIS